MIAAAVVGYLLVVLLYRWFPPITVWTGVSLLALATAERRGPVCAGQDQRRRDRRRARLATSAGGGSQRDDRQGLGVGGAVVLGWWIGVLVYLLPRRSTLRVAGEDTTGAVVAAACALALLVAALWLQHCCRSPSDPPEGARAPKADR
ncbi:hypothetical protein I552_3124 [Mycobacterium xenopi 3993]|nr:hypothetical protein I552_3124 [Mycobacterium xenopi 3993]